MKQRNNKQFVFLVVSVLIFLNIGIFSIFHFSVVQAVLSNGANAVNVIGQLDSEGAVSYTKSISNNGLGTQGFSSAYDTAVDTTNNRLFVSDTNNNRILIFNLDGSDNLVDYTADNVIGQSDFVTTTSATTRTGLSGPRGIEFDSINNRLMIADSGNNRVLVFELAGGLTNGMAASYVLGQTLFTTNSSGYAGTQMNNPVDIVLNGGADRLFIADQNNNRILVTKADSYLANGLSAFRVWGQADFTTTAAATTQNGLSAPSGLAMDAVNALVYVAEQGNNRITVYNISVTIINQPDAVYVLGQEDYVSSGSATDQDGLNGPRGIFYNSNKLYVADYSNNRVMVFDVTAITNGEDAANVLGETNFTSQDAASISQTNLIAPQSVSYNTANNKIFVTSGTNNRVLVFDVTAISDGEPAVNVVGQLDSEGAVRYTSNIPNAGLGTNGFNNPMALAIDTVNNKLFVADNDNNRILVFNLNSSNQLVDYTADNVLGQSNFTSLAAATTQAGLSDPVGLVYDSTNSRLFIADTNNNRIIVHDFGAGATLSDGRSADYVLGQSSFTASTAAATQAGLSGPKGLAYDSTNDYLYAADSSNNRVLVYDVGSIINGENATNVLGQSSFTASAAATTQAGLSDPQFVAYDNDNSCLFIADTTNNRILVHDFSSIALSNNRSADNVLGQTTFTANSTGLTQGTFNTPQGLAYESGSNILFVADKLNNRILIFNLASVSDGENAVYVLGQSDFTSNTSAITQSGFSQPETVMFNSSSKQVFVSDAASHRVMIFDGEVSTAPTASTLAVVPVGDNSGYVTITTQVDDYNDDDTVKVKVEYSDDNGSNWYDAELFSASATIGSPDLDNNEVYQIGTSTNIQTSSGANTLTIVWDSRSAANGNGSILDRQTDIQLRITANDGSADGTAATSASVTIDNFLARSTNPELQSDYQKQKQIIMDIISDELVEIEAEADAIAEPDIVPVVEEISAETGTTVLVVRDGNGIEYQLTPLKRDIQREIDALPIYLKLAKKIPNNDEDWRVINFLAYGNNKKTEKMSPRERRGLLEDYQEIFGHLPQQEKDWLGLARIVEGERPDQKLLNSPGDEIEKTIALIFANLGDLKTAEKEKLIDYLVYRVRPKQRELQREQIALGQFGKLLGYLPSDGFSWSVLRTIAYLYIK